MNGTMTQPIVPARTNDTSAAPAGYKHTEVGTIPEEWDVAAVRELFRFLRTASNSRADLDPSGDVRYVHYGDIHTRWDHVLDFSVADVPRIAATKVGNASLLRDGDLIVADASEDEAGVGKSVEVRNLGDTLAVAGLHTILLRSTDDRLHDGYRGYLQEVASVKAQIRRVATGLKVYGISKRVLRDILVPLPPIPEQCAITQALRDVDKAIRALDKVIAKKRVVRLAAMQQLLTGKIRLPGFRGDWMPVRMQRIGNTYGGLSGKTKIDFGAGNASYVPFLNVLQNVVIDCEQIGHVQVAPGESQHTVRKGDLLFNGSSETPEDLAVGAMMPRDVENLYLNSFCFGFRLHDQAEHDPLFLAYFFRGPVGRRVMYALAQGATRYNLSKHQFLALSISVPKHDEQSAVAGVLSDMDTEIRALERERNKINEIERAMMQQLLTGRVRLTGPSAGDEA